MAPSSSISLDGASATTHDAVRHMPGEVTRDGLTGGRFAQTWAASAAFSTLGWETGLPHVTLMRITWMRRQPSWHGGGGEGACRALYPCRRWGAAPTTGRPWRPMQKHTGCLRTISTTALTTRRPSSAKGYGAGARAARRPLLVWAGAAAVGDSRGDLYPCSLLTEPEFRLGHVDDVSLVEALASQKLHDLARMCDRRRDEIDCVRGLRLAPFLPGSCPGAIWLEYGTCTPVDSFCDCAE